ncbi:MAG: DNA polymerase III subunit gamma/tau, partial [Clostridia bacterium]|nr:DNA polymerase III subunit gamma/tau [Clostridia bacterium]
MAYQALYRKWRPKTFDDVVGQGHVITTLKNEISQGKTAHAYLFCGTRGTGKTSCAKIFARAINCLNPIDGNPCNECEICRGAMDGSILDITEIDAASNNGVDNIRQIKEEVMYSAVHAKYKIYIIDEV